VLSLLFLSERRGGRKRKAISGRPWAEQMTHFCCGWKVKKKKPPLYKKGKEKRVPSFAPRVKGKRQKTGFRDSAGGKRKNGPEHLLRKERRTKAFGPAPPTNFSTLHRGNEKKKIITYFQGKGKKEKEPVSREGGNLTPAASSSAKEPSPSKLLRRKEETQTSSPQPRKVRQFPIPKAPSREKGTVSLSFFSSTKKGERRKKIKGSFLLPNQPPNQRVIILKKRSSDPEKKRLFFHQTEKRKKKARTGFGSPPPPPKGKA